MKKKEKHLPSEFVGLSPEDVEKLKRDPKFAEFMALQNPNKKTKVSACCAGLCVKVHRKNKKERRAWFSGIAYEEIFTYSMCL